MKRSIISIAIESQMNDSNDLQYSEEGFKDIFKKVYDKWKEWFPTTYWTLEGAKQGLLKKLDELRSYGSIGQQYAELIAEGLIKNESALNTLSSSIKAKRQVVSVARFLGQVTKSITEMNSRGRMQRGRFNFELAELAIENKDKEMKEFIAQAERFGDLDLLNRYEQAVNYGSQAIQLSRTGNAIAAALQASSFVKMVKQLPLESFDTDVYLRTYSNKSNYNLNNVDLEEKVLASYYTPLFEVLNYFVQSGAYRTMLKMMYELEVPNYETDADERHRQENNEKLSRLIWKLFGMDFERSCEVVSKQLMNSYVAMLAVRTQCSNYLTLHRLLLQAQIAYVEETIRRIKTAEVGGYGYESFEVSDNLNIPATYPTPAPVDPSTQVDPVETPAGTEVSTEPVEDYAEMRDSAAEDLRDLPEASQLSEEAFDTLVALMVRRRGAKVSTEAFADPVVSGLVMADSQIAKAEASAVIEELSPETTDPKVVEAVIDAVAGQPEVVGAFPTIVSGDYIETLEDGGATEDALCQPVTSASRVAGGWNVKLEGYDGEYFLEDCNYNQTYSGITGRQIHQYQR